jgi:hypothetical protein
MKRKWLRCTECGNDQQCKKYDQMLNNLHRGEEIVGKYTVGPTPKSGLE